MYACTTIMYMMLRMCFQYRGEHSAGLYTDLHFENDTGGLQIL